MVTTALLSRLGFAAHDSASVLTIAVSVADSDAACGLQITRSAAAIKQRSHDVVEKWPECVQPRPPVPRPPGTFGTPVKRGALLPASATAALRPGTQRRAPLHC